MRVVTIHEAKTTLSRLIAQARNGDEIVIAKGKTPVAKIVPFIGKPAKRKFGAFKGRIAIDERFNEPLPADELAAWGLS